MDFIFYCLLFTFQRFLEVIMQHVDEAYTSGELGDIDELPEFVVSKVKQIQLPFFIH